MQVMTPETATRFKWPEGSVDRQDLRKQADQDRLSRDIGQLNQPGVFLSNAFDLIE
jgi:hypothetical protein